MQMTFDEYDQMLEKFERIDTNKVWPTPEQIEMMGQEPDKWISFLCYLVEQNEEPETVEEKTSRKMMMAFLNKHLELVE